MARLTPEQRQQMLLEKKKKIDEELRKNSSMIKAEERKKDTREKIVLGGILIKIYGDEIRKIVGDKEYENTLIEVAKPLLYPLKNEIENQLKDKIKIINEQRKKEVEEKKKQEEINNK